MERKTKVHAEDNKQELTITREFDLPLELLFQAHADPEIIEQWMENKVLKFENKKHGGWQYEKKDTQGNIVFAANGVFHEFIPNRKITRTFEMQNTPFDVQLEFLEFEKLTSDTSKLTMHIVYRTVALRDQMLRMPFAQGLNMAHNRLQETLNKIIHERFDNLNTYLEEVQTNKQLQITRAFKTPIEIMWEVWTTPEHISNWWGPNGFTTTIHKMDFTEGGEWKLTLHGPDGTNYPNRSIFKEIIPFKKIVFEHFNPHFMTTVVFESKDNQTKIEWTMEFDSAEMREIVVKAHQADEGQKQNVERLEKYLAELSTTSTK